MYQILSKQKIFHYFMHMRAKNNMGILDLFPSEFSSMRGVCWWQKRGLTAIEQALDRNCLRNAVLSFATVSTLRRLYGAD